MIFKSIDFPGFPFILIQTYPGIHCQIIIQSSAFCKDNLTLAIYLTLSSLSHPPSLCELPAKTNLSPWASLPLSGS